MSRLAAALLLLFAIAPESRAGELAVEGQVGYVVSGPAERQRLETVTKLIYEQIERNGARKS